MPIHDWTRVDPNIYHHFHGRWIFAMADALNTGILPKTHYALAEQVTRLMGPDVLTLERPAAGQPPGDGPATGEAATLTVTATPPRTRFAVAERPKPLRRRQWRLPVRHVADHRMVALIELVSPSNKAGRYKFKTFVEKAAGAIEAKIHLLVIDPFPPGRRDPNGVHAAIWDEVVGRPFTLPADKPLTIASYSSGEEVAAYVEPVAVGDSLPDMPLFLEPEAYVKVPLEATYQAAWRTFPDEWKAVLTVG